MKKTINQFSGIGSNVLYAKNQVVVFGDPPNDDLVVEQKYIKVQSPSLHNSGAKQQIDEHALDELMSKVQHLTYSNSVAQFIINSELLQQIKIATKEWASTHIRMFPQNGKLRVLMFDCRMNDQKLRVSRKSSLQLRYLDLPIRVFDTFTFTLKSGSFSKLPVEDYAVRIGDNGICAFIASNKNVQFLFRDQDLHEPLITFASPRLAAEIAFAPVPNF